MILFFSGTGNSRYAAQRIGKALGEEALSLNKLIKEGRTGALDVSGKLVIVTPTYAWRIPRLVEEWIRRTEFLNVDKVWFVMTCGSEIGNAAKYNEELCAYKHFQYMGTCALIMPENYIAMFSAPEDAEAEKIIALAEPIMDKAGVEIAEGKAFEIPRNNAYDRIMSTLVNPFFYAFGVKDKKFAADEKCTGCGTCTELCPINNITMEAGRPAWHNRCTHCMACICYCPMKAIEFGKKSVGQPRYHCDKEV